MSYYNPTRRELREKAKQHREVAQQLRKEMKALIAHEEVIKKQCEKKIKAIEKRNLVLEKRVENRVSLMKKAHSAARMVRYFQRITVKEKRAIAAQLRETKAETAYLTKELNWNAGNCKSFHIELMIRSITTYERLVKNGSITFNELAILMASNQKSFFTQEDLIDRYGDTIKLIRRDIKLCLESGLIAKVERKKVYYATLKGKKRLNDIFKYIYEEKIGLFRTVVKKAIDDDTTD